LLVVINRPKIADMDAYTSVSIAVLIFRFTVCMFCEIMTPEYPSRVVLYRMRPVEGVAIEL
jgi:hypothetical protein